MQAAAWGDPARLGSRVQGIGTKPRCKNAEAEKEEIAELAGRLKGHNRGRSDQVGVHGLDVYSLWDSLDAVIGHLRTVSTPRRSRPRGDIRGQRAIGVVYHPEYEHLGNYVPTDLSRRYDALLSIDETEALRPLPVGLDDHEEIPETFPSGR